MTNEEFCKRLHQMAQSPKTYDQMPGLINQARNEKLSILAVSDSKHTAVTIPSENKLFLLCSTTWTPPRLDYVVGETELEGFFEELIESGYNGIAFLENSRLIGLEWKDFFEANRKAKRKG